MKNQWMELYMENELLFSINIINYMKQYVPIIFNYMFRYLDELIC